tara:strand:+ start:2873 stop:4186 length:1314 start_codon:yes stop_codon:yes gene_type:complete
MFTTVLESTTNSKIYHPITGLTNDSRQLQKGDLYIAMNGSYNDGHDFLNDAYLKGAAAAIVQKSNNEIDLQQIQVKSTMYTLEELATKWRKNFDIPIIAITGSNGKTSSKDLLLHILSDDLKVHATKGNFNTAIGLCFTIFELHSYHDLAIFELGASMPGEIKNLCTIASPTHGLITNIAPAHLEGFGSIKKIAEEKGNLFNSLHEGISFVNMTDDYISKMDIKGKKITFGLTPDCDFPADISQEKDGTLTLILDTHEIKTNSHNFSFLKNCIAISAIAITLGINAKSLNDRLKSFLPPKGRCFVTKINGVTIIDDTYNANLTSSLAALEYLNAFSNNGRKIFVFGDMLELGDASEKQHAEVGIKCSSLEIDIVFTIGEQTVFTDSNIIGKTHNKHFQSKEILIKTLKKIVKKNDKILFKGSRSMEMDKIIEKVFDI